MPCYPVTEFFTVAVPAHAMRQAAVGSQRVWSRSARRCSQFVNASKTSARVDDAAGSETGLTGLGDDFECFERPWFLLLL